MRPPRGGRCSSRGRARLLLGLFLPGFALSLLLLPAGLLLPLALSAGLLLPLPSTGPWLLPADPLLLPAWLPLWRLWLPLRPGPRRSLRRRRADARAAHGARMWGYQGWVRSL